MCAWSWLSSVSVSFKNYSSTPGWIMFSSRGCLEGVTDSLMCDLQLEVGRMLIFYLETDSLR